jgi:hypothetical protein
MSMQHITMICTSRPGCPCKFCGGVRLMLDQERVRITRDWDECASQDQLARQYVAEFLATRPKEKP